MITIIDGYRVNYFDDLNQLDKPIKDGELGSEIASEWKRIRRSMMKIATTIKFIPQATKYIKLQSLLRLIAMMLLVSGLLVIIMTQFSPLTGNVTVTFVFSFMAACALIASRFAGKEVAKSIDAYFKEHYKKYGFIREQLKNEVQKLIYTLAIYIKRTGEKSEDHPIKLYNADYKGIEILKHPWLLRKHYIAIVRLKK